MVPIPSFFYPLLSLVSHVGKIKIEFGNAYKIISCGGLAARNKRLRANPAELFTFWLVQVTGDTLDTKLSFKKTWKRYMSKVFRYNTFSFQCPLVYHRITCSYKR